MKKLFKQQSSTKEASPDSVSTSTLKHFAGELAPVFTELYNSSFHQHTAPVCFKAATIIPVPKKSKVIVMNDYHPVALTSVVMKVLERLVLKYLKWVTNSHMDPLHFPKMENRSTDDAVDMALHFVLQHLESPNMYARFLFIDYSSALNTIVTQKLFDKLRLLSVDVSMFYSILDFLLAISVRQNELFCFQNYHLEQSVPRSVSSPRSCSRSSIMTVCPTSPPYSW